MFDETVLNKYADVLIWGLETARKTTGGEFKKGDIIIVRYELDSLKLAEILHRKLLEKGFHVVMKMDDTPKMEFDFFDVANEEQLKFLAPWNKTLYKHLNGSIWLGAPASLTHLSSIDPKKFAVTARVGKLLCTIRNKREEKGEFGWTLCMMPTKALAEKANMSVEEYGEEIIRACYLDKENPVTEWEKLYKESIAIKTWLNELEEDIDHLHIESENTDLMITPGSKRKWLGVSGHNIPSFEIFTSPDWRGTKGIYYANMPSFVMGNYVEGVRLVFKKGNAVGINAKIGEEFVKKMLATDKGAGRIGEISFTDKRFSPIRKFMAHTLFDENVGGEEGNCHIAVGASYSDTYSGNPKELTKKMKKEIGFNDSAIHWDLINTERKKMTAHLKTGGTVVIYENGVFKKD